MQEVLVFHDIPAAILDGSLKAALAGLAGVYLLRNRKTGQCYVGGTRDLWCRILYYRRPSWLAQRPNHPIVGAIIEHGLGSFTLTILEKLPVDSSEATIRATEQRYIDDLQPDYNVTKVAGKARGHKNWDETRASVSAATLRPRSDALRGITDLAPLSPRAMVVLVKDMKNPDALVVMYSSISEAAEALGTTQPILGGYHGRILRRRYLIYVSSVRGTGYKRD
jgi:hypothetical protein